VGEGVRVRLLGTAAAEGWPAVFCRCPHCQRARTLGGKDIRRRASASVDGIFQFDFGPDAYAQVLAGHDASAVEHLILTHSHHDHLAPADLDMRRPPFAHGVPGPLHVWGNARCLDRIRAALGDPGRCGIELHQVQPFVAAPLGDATLIPLLADHDPQEDCLLYLFGRGGRWLLYGHDSGIFPEATWSYLARWAREPGYRLDLALLDCTNGPRPGERNHMGLPANAVVRRRLLEMGAAGPRTRFVATHFSHNGGACHAELEAAAAPLGLEVAYDGMELDVPPAL
jgi:phosphoribosyl 1,2-cyclic phosphate phosphodiesterase